MAKKKAGRTTRLRIPRLTGLPPVEAVHAPFNLSLRFRACWPRPHLGLLPRRSPPPWPPEVWEVLYATLLRCVIEKDARWADAFEKAVGDVFSRLRSFDSDRATVRADELSQRLQAIRVKLPRGRPQGTGVVHDERAKIFCQELAARLRPHYTRQVTVTNNGVQVAGEEGRE